MNVMNEQHLTQGTTSPFLPDTKLQFAWDSTSLGYLKTCPRLYQYIMIDGWQSSDESVHLRFGTEYHAALQAYDIARTQGVSHEDAVHDTIYEVLQRTADFHPDPDTKAGKYKNRSMLISLVLDYLDHFVDDPAKVFVKGDGTPAVELSFRFEMDFGPSYFYEDGSYPKGHSIFDKNPQPYLLCGHLDKVVDLNDALFVLDHKTTTTTVSSYYFHQWEPNNQMTLYTIGGQVVLNSPIKGVIISAAQIMLTEPHRFVRGFTYRTQDQIEEWLRDLQMLLITNEGYAEADYWPLNDTACDKFGGCRFRSVCSKSPQVREMFLKADFVQKPPEERWNPLASR